MGSCRDKQKILQNYAGLSVGSVRALTTVKSKALLEINNEFVENCIYFSVRSRGFYWRNNGFLQNYVVQSVLSVTAHFFFGEN
jgi:hypothetical protein